MPDLQKQHDGLRASLSRAREEWWAAQLHERAALAKVKLAQQRLIDFDKRNEGSDD